MARGLHTAVVSVIALGLARLAAAQDTAGSAVSPAAPTSRHAATASLSKPLAGIPVNEALRLDEYLSRLDEWRNQGRITAAESARARRVLQAAIVSGESNAHVPLDASGRIDLLALARGTSTMSAGPSQPGEKVISRVVNEFDLRMRVKARDLAWSGSAVMLDAAPGYMAAPGRDLGRIVTGALETTPMRELPGGTQFVQTVGALTNTRGARPEHTFAELSRKVGDGQRDRFRSGLGGFITDHKIQAGLIAFGAITGLRMSSPQTARALDRMGIRLRIARLSTPDARVYTTGRLIYRNAYILPELEFESGARHVSGAMTLRATVGGTVGAEASEHARGRVGFGARWERGRWFTDTNAIYGFPEHLTRAELRGGYLTETGFVLSGALAATFGHEVAGVHDSPRHLSAELDLTRPITVGRSEGEAGLFIGSTADGEFTTSDWRAGMVFRLRF